jgi:thiol-disulfide isomerase/thioredoxin
MSTVSSDPGAASTEFDAPQPGPALGPAGAPRRRRRLALWVSLGVGVIVAVLIAVLATSGQASEQLTNSPLLGKPAPELHGRALLNGPPGGGQVRLSSYSGKWVLVNFAASWCVPCQEEMPQLLLFAKQHASGDATILTVQFDQSDGTNLKHFLQARSVGRPSTMLPPPSTGAWAPCPTPTWSTPRAWWSPRSRGRPTRLTSMP